MGWKEIILEAAKSRSYHSVAREAGIDPSHFSRFRHGEARLSMEACERLCVALGLKLVAAGETRAAMVEAPKIGIIKSVAPMDLMPSDDGPEPRFPVKLTKVDNRPVLKPAEDIPVGFDPRPSTPSPKPRFSAAEINRRKKLGMPTD